MKMTKQWHWLVALGITVLGIIVTALLGALFEIWLLKTGWFG